MPSNDPNRFSETSVNSLTFKFSLLYSRTIAEHCFTLYIEYFVVSCILKVTV